MPYLFLALAWLLASVSSVGAQPSPMGDIDEPPPAYLALIEEAVRESAAERWVEARSLFREAQRVYPNARALRGEGMTSFELRDYTAAHRALSASLTEPRRALDPEQRAQVEALLQRVNELIARYSVDHLGEGAMVAVDAVRQEADAEGYVLVPAGRHEVVVTTADGRQVRGAWTVRGGELGPLPMELSETRPMTDTPPVTEAEPARAEALVAPSVPAPEPRDYGPLGWSLVAGGVAVAVTGMALTVVGRRDQQLLEAPPANTRWDDVAVLQSRSPRFMRAGTVMTLLGTASAVTGLVLVLRSGRDSDGAAVRASLLPNGGHLEVQW
ncbi:MAG: hypothetical protein H6726_20100 [Sandaracinaceae bacterium]|nr:hypothetical protein [Sandaracinaceae bacterium]